ncbi:MAG: ACT domain-containing protein [Promethearchaeota archaeon]
MNETEILKMDSRGRIVIPKSMRKILNLDENSNVMAIADPNKQEIRIVPFLGAEDTLTVRVEMLDIPGSLSRIAGIFAELKLNLLYGQSKIIKRGEAAEWTVICQVPDELPLEELKKLLMEKGGASQVEFFIRSSERS